jgi:Tfp pilus assembly protein FimT
MVTILIGIMAGMATVYFQSYVTKYSAANDMKQLYSDLMYAKALAVTKARGVGIRQLNSNSYVQVEDVNEDGDFNDPGETNQDVKQTKMSLTWNLSGAGDIIAFNSQGIANRNGRISVGVSEAEYDCVVISPTRIALGKMTGGNCEPK